MDQQRYLLQPGFLLHQRAYGEHHAVLELFTREQGRTAVVARGVRSARSRRRGILQPFGRLLLSWQTRGELGLLTDVEAAGGAPLRGRAVISGLYLNEILLRLLRRDDPHPELYDSYARTLSALAAGQAEASVLRIFERDLLEQSGYGLLLEHDAGGQPLEPEQEYEYRLEEGPVPTAGASGLIVRGESLLALARGQVVTPRQQQDTKRLMRAALAPHLGERPLKSRELYAQRRPERPPSGDSNEHEQ